MAHSVEQYLRLVRDAKVVPHWHTGKWTAQEPRITSGRVSLSSVRHSSAQAREQNVSLSRARMAKDASQRRHFPKVVLRKREHAGEQYFDDFLRPGSYCLPHVLQVFWRLRFRQSRHVGLVSDPLPRYRFFPQPPAQGVSAVLVTAFPPWNAEAPNAWRHSGLPDPRDQLGLLVVCHQSRDALLVAPRLRLPYVAPRLALHRPHATTHRLSSSAIVDALSTSTRWSMVALRGCRVGTVSNTSHPHQWQTIALDLMNSARLSL